MPKQADLKRIQADLEEAHAEIETASKVDGSLGDSLAFGFRSLLAAIGQLSATANWHRIMSEWLNDSPPTSPLGLAEADFFGLPPTPVQQAA